jgi:hypothetical protein
MSPSANRRRQRTGDGPVNHQSSCDRGALNTRRSTPSSEAQCFSVIRQHAIATIAIRDSQRLGDGVASCQSAVECVSRNASHARPFPKVARLAVQRQQSISARVVRLLLFRGPATIAVRILHAWAGIGTVDVQAVKRITRRTFAHVSEECFKRIAPLLRHGNPASTVARPSDLAWIVATCFSSGPCAIGARMGLSMRASQCPNDRPAQTSATLGLSIAEALHRYGGEVPALAAARPHRSASARFTPLDERESSEDVVDGVNLSGSHAVAPPMRGRVVRAERRVALASGPFSIHGGAPWP